MGIVEVGHGVGGTFGRLVEPSKCGRRRKRRDGSEDSLYLLRVLLLLRLQISRS